MPVERCGWRRSAPKRRIAVRTSWPISSAHVLYQAPLQRAQHVTREETSTRNIPLELGYGTAVSLHLLRAWNEILAGGIAWLRGGAGRPRHQADIARLGSKTRAGHVLREVSRQTSGPSRVSAQLCFSRRRTTSTEHGAWSTIDRATLPSNHRSRRERPCDPRTIKSESHSLASSRMTVRGSPLRTTASDSSEAVLSIRATSFVSSRACRVCSSLSWSNIVAPASAKSAAGGGIAWTADNTRTTVPEGQGRDRTSSAASRECGDPSTASMIFM